jgi:DNA-binding transcriptional MerR regulator
MPSDDLFAIGRLALRTGVKAPTIRYYEQIGLLEVPPRSEGDRRLYNAAAVQRLTFIRHARELGFGIDAVRVLIDLTRHPERACTKANAIADKQLELVEAKIARLTLLKDELARIASVGCDGAVAECRVIEALNDHGQCVHPEHGPAGRL